jgi:uncharacterized protein YndB with AHSA1/START domain
MKLLSASAAYTPDGALVMRRSYTAPVERVFRAWIDARDLSAWYTPSSDWPVKISDMDLRVTGGFTGAFGPAGEPPYVERVQFLAIDPLRHLDMLVSLTQNGALLALTRARVDFTDLGDTSELTLTETGASAEAREGRLQGWAGTLDNLERIKA